MLSLEAPVRLSHSRLWALISEFYENQGASAWSDNLVPSRISSNPMIAHAYAQVIGGWMRDIAKVKGPEATISIVELGAGSGQFTYLLLRAMIYVSNALAQNAVALKWRYIVTDIAASNVQALLASPALRPFVDSGLLDVAELDVAIPERARSAVSRRLLSEILGGEPTVLISNYVFDSLKIDAFEVINHELHELKVGLDVKEPPAQIVGSHALFEKIRFRLAPAPMVWPYYEAPHCDEVLRELAEAIDSGVFLFPTSAIGCLEAFKAFSGGDLLTIMGDKAKAEAREFEGARDLGIHLTGAFSSYVNAAAISRWVARSGGVVKRSHRVQKRFDVYGFLLGEIGVKGELELAFEAYVRQLGPAYLHWVESALVEDPPKMSARAWIAAIVASRYDPYLVLQCVEPLLGVVKGAEPHEKALFHNAFLQALDNYFPVNAKKDPCLPFARLFHDLGDLPRALALYQRAAATRDVAAFALPYARCCAQLGHEAQALELLRLAVA